MSHTLCKRWSYAAQTSGKWRFPQPTYFFKCVALSLQQKLNRNYKKIIIIWDYNECKISKNVTICRHQYNYHVLLQCVNNSFEIKMSEAFRIIPINAHIFGTILITISNNVIHYYPAKPSIYTVIPILTVTYILKLW